MKANNVLIPAIDSACAEFGSHAHCPRAQFDHIELCSRQNNRALEIMVQTPKNQAHAFSRTDVWIFDLDNTLYPAKCNLFAQIDRRMGEFIADRLGLSLAAAKKLQKQYYRDYGTTMNGLMTLHQIEPAPYLAYVHDIDLSPVKPDAVLDGALERLPGRKFVFTNGSADHAAGVMERLGIARHFDDVFDIAAADYVPKPAPASYLAFIKKAEIEAHRSTMFDDLARNLEVPHELGMTTVLIRTADHPDPPSFEAVGDDLAHVSHIIGDLAGFLDEIAPLR